MNEYFVHPTAIVDDGCTIGNDTHIWHFTHIMERCTIGDRCNIGQNVFIAPGVAIGANVKVQNNVSLYAGVTCDDDVFIGPSVVFTNVLNPRSEFPRRNAYLPTHICRGASLGANSTIVCGITIGSYALIGAGAVVTRDVPQYALVSGNPAKVRGWVSRAGHKLHFDDKGEARCPETGETYRLENNQVCLINENSMQLD